MWAEPGRFEVTSSGVVDSNRSMRALDRDPMGSPESEKQDLAKGLIRNVVVLEERALARMDPCSCGPKQHHWR